MSAADEYAISVAKTEYREGYNTGDLERVLSVVADSFSNMSEGEPSFYGAEGKEALGLQVAKLFSRYDVQMEMVIIDIAILGDTAIDRGWHKLILRPKCGGDKEVRRYRYCEIWQKQADGSWKIGFFISNQDYEPEMLAV
jgi:ketosteroid isomerase-like protein